jgi:hypothetical protein
MELAQPELVKRGHNKYDVVYGDDKGLSVEFKYEPQRQGFESEKQGREIYKTVEMIYITCPGAPVRVVAREATEFDKERFAQHYAAFKRNEKVIVEGTPLKELTFLNVGQIATYAASGLHTVEQLAALPDQSLDMLGLGGRDLREKAKMFLSKASDNALITQTQAENKNLRADLEAMKKQIEELSKPKETLSLKQEKK